MSVTTKRTPTHAGPMRACPPRPNGKLRRCPCRSGVISLSTKPFIPSPSARSIPLSRWSKFLETSGSGPKVTIPPIPGTPQHQARRGSITANLWPTSLCCAAGRVRPRSRISGPPIGTFSLPMPDGSSWGSGSPERSGSKLYAPKVGQRARDLSKRVNHDDGFEIMVTIAMENEAIHNKRFQFHDMDAAVHRHTFGRDVAFGLTAPQKWLPPKYFYDERGSQLYERICALPEYYLYRAELEILSTYAAEIHAEIGHLALVEFGSGYARKTRHLLTPYEWAGQPFRYCPVDISREILWNTANRLLQEYTHIESRAMHTDFAGEPEVIQAFQLEKKAVAFFGSSLGNFTPEESVEFLRRTAAILGPEDVFLLGI